MATRYVCYLSDKFLEDRFKGAGGRSEQRIWARSVRGGKVDEELVDLIMNESEAKDAVRKKNEHTKAKEEFNRKKSMLDIHRNESMKNLLGIGGDEDEGSSIEFDGTSLETSSVSSPLRTINPNVQKNDDRTSRRKKKKKKKGTRSFQRTQREMDAMAHSDAASQALGTTQLNGCIGDFCDIAISIDKSLDGMMKSYDHLSDFRRKLLEQEGEAVGWNDAKDGGRKRTKRGGGGGREERGGTRMRTR